MDFKEFSAKTVDDAITEACKELGVTSDKLEYEVIESGSAGFLGIGAKEAVIKARLKEEEKAVSEEKPGKKKGSLLCIFISLVIFIAVASSLFVLMKLKKRSNK